MSEEQVDKLTWRTLLVAHDAHLLNEWDHTATITAAVHNVMILLANAWGKNRLKPVSPDDIHPFRIPKPKGLKVTPTNFGVLKNLVGIKADWTPTGE